jgi:allophanate hydrolase
MGATGHILPVPSRPRGRGPGETEIALVGAHMSGLPLNGQITASAGGSSRPGTTRPTTVSSRSQAGPPARPGLLRVTDGGAAIAVELWAVPTAGLGQLLDQIPVPLGLGRVRLGDGREVTGFLAEAAGLDGARDITDHGGWRAFLASIGAVDSIIQE